MTLNDFERLLVLSHNVKKRLRCSYIGTSYIHMHDKFDWYNNYINAKIIAVK